MRSPPLPCLSPDPPYPLALRAGDDGKHAVNLTHDHAHVRATKREPGFTAPTSTDRDASPAP